MAPRLDPGPAVAPARKPDHQAPGTPTLMRHSIFQIGSGWFSECKGGAENMFYNLYLGLRHAGFAVRGIVPGSALPESETGGEITAFRADRVSQARRAMEIRQLSRASFDRNNFDLIASHFALYTLPLFDRLAGLPFVVHFMGPWALESRAEGGSAAAVLAKKCIERLVYSRADRVIVMSQAFGRIAQEQYGVPDSKLRFVPGGADCDKFAIATTSAEARMALGWERDRPVLLAVRRLVRRMGIDRLIDAMAIVRRSDRDVTLYIAGSGPEKRALEARAMERGLGEAVRFIGFLPDDLLPLAYRAANLTVVPSYELEGFGLIAAESLAAGTPVLVTPVGGLPEVVSGLFEGLVLPGNQPEAMAAGILAALTAPSVLPAPDACRRYARERFDWPVVASRVAGIYRELV